MAQPRRPRPHRIIGFTLPEGVEVPTMAGVTLVEQDGREVVYHTRDDGATECLLDWVCREHNLPYSCN